VDVDPVLLKIASATFADDDERVRIVRADLRGPSWAEAVPEPQVDSVVLDGPALAARGCCLPAVPRSWWLIRRGGVVAHTEQMPMVELPRLGAALAGIDHQRRIGTADRRRRWDAWWTRAASDPQLKAATAQRRAVFETNYPTEEFMPPADWHLAALTNAGFAEVGLVWRSGTGAVVAAVR
jgi:hypothetical protein